MLKKLILPAVAVAGFGFAVYAVVKAREVPAASKPLVSPPTQTSYRRKIAGAGIIEARLENIPVGSPVPGVVWEVYVHAKDQVKKGDPLFRIDDRDLRADLEVREASLASAIASFRRLEAAPQTGDIPTAEATVEETRAKLHDAEASAGRSDRLYQKQMGTASDYDRDRYAFQAAKANLAKASADVNRLKLTWEADKQVAKASVAMADSQVRSTRTQLDRLVVRALADGEILQVNVRPGMFAAALWNQALVVIGDSNRLHVRVDIDENDVPLFDPKAPAVATLKGRPGVKFDLVPYKVEPYVIPKRSLTGDNSERVDTRVLQVVYALPDHPSVKLYIGQQMDAYIESDPSEGISLDPTDAPPDRKSATTPPVNPKVSTGPAA